VGDEALREDYLSVGKWLEFLTLPFIKLVLKLNPMQPEVMQETLHHIHEHKDKECDRGEHKECECQLDY